MSSLRNIGNFKESFLIIEINKLFQKNIDLFEEKDEISLYINKEKNLNILLKNDDLDTRLLTVQFICQLAFNTKHNQRSFQLSGGLTYLDIMHIFNFPENHQNFFSQMEQALESDILQGKNFNFIWIYPNDGSTDPKSHFIGFPLIPVSFQRIQVIKNENLPVIEKKVCSRIHKRKLRLSQIESSIPAEDSLQTTNKEERIFTQKPIEVQKLQINQNRIPPIKIRSQSVKYKKEIAESNQDSNQNYDSTLGSTNIQEVTQIDQSQIQNSKLGRYVNRMFSRTSQIAKDLQFSEVLPDKQHDTSTEIKQLLKGDNQKQLIDQEYTKV